MSESSKLFAHNIKRIRKDLKMSQMKFSELVGISEKTLFLIEKGQTRIFFNTIDKLSEALNLHKSAFFEEIEDAKKVSPKIQKMVKKLKNSPQNWVILFVTWLINLKN